MDYLKSMAGYLNYYVAAEIYYLAGAAFLMFIYSLIRGGVWRRILASSLDYHKFHLNMIMNDSAVDTKNRELAQAMIWAITRQLPDDIKKMGGGKALLRSFMGEKTALNTCGSIFYDIARNYRYIDQRIVKLNNTLLGTFYRIFFLESFLSGVSALYMDIFLLKSFIFKPLEGSPKLYLEMFKELKASKMEET